MLMGCTDALAYLVMYNQLLLECFVGQEDLCGHSRCSGQCNDQWPKELIETLIDINAGSSDINTNGVL